MKTEYIKKLQTMKLSEAIEELWGIKLLQYQKTMVDTIIERRDIVFTPLSLKHRDAYLDGIKAILDVLKE